MKSLFIELQEDTPKVVLDKENQHFEIMGRSLPEDVTEFYNPILEWIDSYLEDPLQQTNFHFKLDYFNTASSKLLLDIMLKLEEGKGDIVLKWHYDPADRDLMEAGEEYADLVDIQFDLISIV